MLVFERMRVGGLFVCVWEYKVGGKGKLCDEGGSRYMFILFVIMLFLECCVIGWDVIRLYIIGIGFCFLILGFIVWVLIGFVVCW